MKATGGTMSTGTIGGMRSAAPMAGPKAVGSVRGPEGGSFSTAFSSRSFADSKPGMVNKNAFSPRPSTGMLNMNHGREAKSSFARTTSLVPRTGLERPQKTLNAPEKTSAPKSEFGVKLNIKNGVGRKSEMARTSSLMVPGKLVDLSNKARKDIPHTKIQSQSAEVRRVPHIKIERARRKHAQNVEKRHHIAHKTQRVSRLDRITRPGQEVTTLRRISEVSQHHKAVIRLTPSEAQSAQILQNYVAQGSSEARFGSSVVREMRRLSASPEVRTRVVTRPTTEIQHTQKTTEAQPSKTTKGVIRNTTVADMISVDTTASPMLVMAVQIDAKHAEGMVKTVAEVYKLSEKDARAKLMMTLRKKYETRHAVKVMTDTKTQTKTEAQLVAETKPKTAAQIAVEQRVNTNLQVQEKPKTQIPEDKKQPDSVPAQEKVFYIKEDTVAQEIRIRRATQALEYVMQNKKDGEEITGQDIASQISDLGGEATSEIAKLRGNDGTVKQFLQRLSEMGTIKNNAFFKDVVDRIEKFAAAAKAVKFSKTDQGNGATEENVAEVLGSIEEKMVYFKEHESPTGQLKKGVKTLYVPEGTGQVQEAA